MSNSIYLDKINTYIRFKEVEEFLNSLVFSKPTPHFVATRKDIIKKQPFGLERIGSFLKSIGNPHLKNKYIHVGGTSGKTSTTYFTSNILTGQGYKTGMHVSPHMTSLLERFTIDNKLPPTTDIIDLIDGLKHNINSEYLNHEYNWISYFEFIVSAALKYFELQKTDYVVLEVGLGGRLDGTNIIENSEVSIITNIGLDHTHILGNTKEEIAIEKLGILKNGCPVITSETDENILNIFKEEAAKKDCPIEILGRNFRIENVKTKQDRTIFDYKSDTSSYTGIELKSLGGYQARNSSLSIRSLELILRKQSKKMDENSLRNSLLHTNIPGRFEVVSTDPTIILDGAHNLDKIKCFVDRLRNFSKGKDVIFVCGFTTGRDIENILKEMSTVSNKFYLTRVFTGHREDEEPKYLLNCLKDISTNKENAITSSVVFDPKDAVKMAISDAKENSKIVCVTGSLYLVSYVRNLWYPEFENITNFIKK